MKNEKIDNNFFETSRNIYNSKSKVRINKLFINTEKDISVTNSSMSPNFNQSFLSKTTNQLMKLNTQNKLIKNSLTSLLRDKYSPELRSENSEIKDVDPLISFYHMNNCNDYNADQRKLNNDSKKQKKLILGKYGIKEKSDDEQYQKISSILKRNESPIRKTHKINILEEKFFKNPFKSQDKIRLNKQICENITKINLNKQANLYSDCYYKILNEEKKIELMPEIKTSLNEVIKIDPNLQGIYSIDINKIKTINFLNQNMNISRETFLYQNLKFGGELKKFTSNKPKSRAQSAISSIDNQIFLFGGINNVSLNDLWVCNIQNNYKWRQLIPKGELPLPRFGHTSVIFRKEVFIYGGEIDDRFQAREDICIYDITNNSFNLDVKCVNKSNLKWRRNHICELVGNYMVIFGGVSEENSILDDLWALDIQSTFRWNPLSTIGQKPPGLAFCCSALVLTSDKRTHPSVSLFKIPEMPLGRNSKYKNEGIFVYGGVDSQGVINDKLYILKIGRRPLEWICPEVEGDCPVGLINSTLNYYEPLNILILFGGKCKNQEYHNQLYVLDLENFKWIKLKNYDLIPKERSEHVSLTTNSEFITFGGINESHYLGSDIFVFNLDALYKKKSFYEVDLDSTKKGERSKFDRRNKIVIRKSGL